MRNGITTLAIAASMVLGSIATGQVPSHVEGSGSVDQYDIGIEEVVPSDKGDTLIVYSANWCLPCQLMKPMWITLRAQGYRVIEINTNTHKSKQEMSDREKEIFLSVVPKKVPTIYWYNSNAQTRVGEKHEGSNISMKEIKERLWKKSSLPVSQRVQEQ